MLERYIQVKRVPWAKELVELYNHAEQRKFMDSYILDATGGVANCARKEIPDKTEKILTLRFSGNKDVPESIHIEGTVRKAYICPHKQVWCRIAFNPKLENI